MTVRAGGFDGLAGAGRHPSLWRPPDGVRTSLSRRPEATRLVLIRHGEAVCNMSGVCGGLLGCRGLTHRGGSRSMPGPAGPKRGTGRRRRPLCQHPAPGHRDGRTAGPCPGPAGRTRAGPLALVTECGLCELHPGEADGLSWDEFSARFGPVDWDADPDRPIAPGGESWTGFVDRVERALDAVEARHPGQLVVVATHAGVIEASLLAKLPVAGGRDGARLQLAHRPRLPHHLGDQRRAVAPARLQRRRP